MKPIHREPLTQTPLLIRRLGGKSLERDAETGAVIYHAVPSDDDTAICGVTPGASRPGWSTQLGPTVTCARCLAQLAGDPPEETR